MLAVGEKAPEFKLQDQLGEWKSLADYLSRGPLMIAFYPGDFTPVCTRQLCAYQDSHNRFSELGINVLGISDNVPSEHAKFRTSYGFAFDLLSDPGKEIARKFGASSLWLFGGISRAVYILNASGRVLYRHVEPTVLTFRKADELVSVIDELRKGNKL